MSHDRTLRTGARTAGTVLLAALAVLDLAWIVRDFDKATDVIDAWWMWSGLIFRAQDGIWASSFVEPTLLVLYTVCAVTTAVSSSAGGILVSTGALTILLRVPTLWNLNASWVRSGVSDGLRNTVLASVIAMLVIGAALIVLALAGRLPRRSSGGRPEAEDSGGARSTRGDRSTRDEPPARPTRAGGAVACGLLAAVTAVLVSWEVHAATRQGWELYSRHFTGDRSLATLLAVPESWYGCALALVSLCAAVAALARTPYSRPLGMTVSGPLLGLGLFRLSFGAKAGLLGGFGGLTTRDQLWLSTAAFEILAAFGILLALSARDGDTTTGPEAQSGTTRALSSASSA
ncbi:hypothetical protein [Streptomyces winkii]|uniref:hypothetical protein n=1 Tax=Streptomyces winkii TaxID=3051178 RepID=UPI0028D68310|nr:hypothetical protein [Streptomyces sp. DSM 40971]